MPNPQTNAPATLYMVNETGNRAGFGTQQGYGGGGLNNPGATATATNVTIIRNRASAGGGPPVPGRRR
jgi:hypothetical protein